MIHLVLDDLRRPALIAGTHFAEGKIQDPAEHGPDYLRKSQAEREREEKEAKLAEAAGK